MRKPLPDIISDDLKILFIGFNPGIHSARTGHHYAHKSNRFWKLLHESGITPVRFLAEDDGKLLYLGYGSTNIADRPTESADMLSKEELLAGADSLYKMIQKIRPKIACYVGIGVYRIFASAILKISPGRVAVKTGLQPESLVEGTMDYVCSNPSGLNTIPYQEQLKCFQELKGLVDNPYNPIKC